MTLGLLVALENANKHTNIQDSCFIGIDGSWVKSLSTPFLIFKEEHALYKGHSFEMLIAIRMIPENSQCQTAKPRISKKSYVHVCAHVCAKKSELYSEAICL